MNNPLVSIVIPVYNGENYLAEAIESALRQTYQNVEILIINDGSDDNGSTEKIALSYKDVRIRYYHKPNGGVATALNLAIENMKGEYFSWLSHDDVYLPTKVESQIKYLVSRGNMNAVVYSGFEMWNMSNGDKSGYEYHKYFKQEQLENSLFPVIEGMVAGCTLLIPRKVFAQVGVFDETRLTTQDYDLWLTIFRSCTTYYLSEILVSVRVHENQGSKVIQKFRKEQAGLLQRYIEDIPEKEQEKIYGSKTLFYLRMGDLYYAYGMKQMYQRVLEKLSMCKETTREITYRIQCKQHILDLTGNRKLCIYGTGINGKKLYHLLDSRGISAFCFTNTFIKEGYKTEEGICCIPFQELMPEKDDIFYIIAVDNYQMIMDGLENININSCLTYLDIEKYCLLHG